LKRQSALYFGGNEGLIPDTFYSVIAGSFYRRTYHPFQTQIVFAALAATLAAFAVVLYVSFRRTELQRRVLPAVALLAITGLATVAVVAERFMFETPYPLGRTALFYIPVSLLFVTFLLDTIAGLGRAGTAVARSVVMVVLALSLSHFMATCKRHPHTRLAERRGDEDDDGGPGL
jgi:hypothetical protein